MPRLLLVASLVALLLVPTTGASPSRMHVRGTVGSKSQAAHLVSVRATRNLFALRVPGSVSRIRVGEHVELRGSTLRSAGRGSSLLATGVTVVRTTPLATPQTPTASGGQGEDEQPEAQAADDDDITGPSANDDQSEDATGPSDSDGQDDDNGVPGVTGSQDGNHGGPGSGDDNSNEDG